MIPQSAIHDALRDLFPHSIKLTTKYHVTAMAKDFIVTISPEPSLYIHQSYHVYDLHGLSAMEIADKIYKNFCADKIYENFCNDDIFIDEGPITQTYTQPWNLKVDLSQTQKAMLGMGDAFKNLQKAIQGFPYPPIHSSVGPADYALNHPGLKQIVRCPEKMCHNKDRLNHVIVELNDDHSWTREQIADWLDTLDEQPIFYPEIEANGEALPA